MRIAEDVIWFEFVEAEVFLVHAGRIQLLYLFSKREQSDLSPNQTRIIAALSQRIRNEGE